MVYLHSHIFVRHSSDRSWTLYICDQDKGRLGLRGCGPKDIEGNFYNTSIPDSRLLLSGIAERLHVLSMVGHLNYSHLVL
jgi:hypothetical protein